MSTDIPIIEEAPNSKPITLSIQFVDGEPCTPQTLSVNLGGGRGLQTVTRVRITYVPPNGDQALLGQYGLIEVNEPNGGYHFAYETHPADTYILPKCTAIYSSCKSGLTGPTAFKLGEYGANNPKSNAPYTIIFASGIQYMYHNGITATPIVPGNAWKPWGDSSLSTCSETVPCIPTGQKVLTPNGYQLIETLKSGDFILTPDGRSVEINMVSWSLPIATACGAPILIPANTFGENSPINDIVLSPRHFIMIKPNVWDLPRNLIERYDELKRLNLGEHVFYYNIETPNYLTDDLVVEGSIVESYGRSFSNKYPGKRNYYSYNNELKGYTRITMNDVKSENKFY
jgi:hypothetical protein